MAYDAPEFTTRVTANVWVTTQGITIQVWDSPVSKLPRAQLWTRYFERPPGKSEEECVQAALRALWASLDRWKDLIGQQDQPLDGLEW